MKNTLWITVFSVVSLCSPVVCAMSYEEEAPPPPAPAPQPERPKHPARVVEAEQKKEAAEIPADLQELVARVQTLDNAAFDEFVRCCGEKQDWPSSVVLRCLSIAAGAGHGPSQIELIKRSLGIEPQIAKFWLFEVALTMNAETLRETAAWLRARSGGASSDLSNQFESRAAALESGNSSVQNPIFSIESQYQEGGYPSLTPGSEAACALERGAKLKKTTQPTPQVVPTPQPVARPSQGSVSPQALQNLVPLYDRLARLRCREAYSALCQRRLLMLLGLIRNGANINVTTVETKGSNALHYACALGSLSITKWLLENGADPNARTNKGADPLTCVGSDNREAIIQLLKQYGAGQN